MSCPPPSGHHLLKTRIPANNRGDFSNKVKRLLFFDFLHFDSIDVWRERISGILFCTKTFQLAARLHYASPLIIEFCHSLIVGILSFTKRDTDFIHVFHEHAHALEHFVRRAKEKVLRKVQSKERLNAEQT